MNFYFQFNCDPVSSYLVISASTLALIPQRVNDKGSYLAGLIEGDGSICVPENKRDKNGKLKHAHVEIVFDIKDLVLATYLKSQIGGYMVKKETSCRLTIKKAESLYILINLINGFFSWRVTPLLT